MRSTVEMSGVHLETRRDEREGVVVDSRDNTRAKIDRPLSLKMHAIASISG